MANNIEDDDDESKLITQFFLNTCRMMQPSILRASAANLCAVHAIEQWNMNIDDEIAYIPLITGSVAEFYIQPMLPHFGDFDLMFHRSDVLAIPCGYLPPSQLPAEFSSRVKVCEIIDRNCYPGYVCLTSRYLLTENADTDIYDAILDENLLGFLPHFTGFDDKDKERIEVHGPARSVLVDVFDTTLDRVYCVRCLWWPTQAANWPTRHRNYGWPDSATVDRVVSNGCDAVQVAHRIWRTCELVSKIQFRLSFSRAEIVLLNSWMPVQQIVYHMLRFFVKTEGLTDITDHTGSKPVSNYHFKTLMLWACELKPRSWWIDDMNVVRICVSLLHSMAKWLENKKCRHYFVKNCNIHDTTSDVETIVGQLMWTTESWLSKWFVDNYLQRCARLCPDKVSQLFDDVGTCMKLQNAVSAVVDFRLNSALADSCLACYAFEGAIARTVNSMSLNVWCCHCWITEFAKIDSSLVTYFTAVACLKVAYITTSNSLSEKLIDVLVTILGHVVCKRRHSGQSRSVLLLRQSTKLMKFVATSQSRSNVQLIEIELSKAYLYKALRCKDSDSDSIYCLANIYLAVLYYITGQHQRAIDHCTLVTRSQHHSQCSSHVVQGELLPKIDDNIDTVLGLSVFYQYVRTAALNQQQAQHVSVFTTELFARYLHIRCLSYTQVVFVDEAETYTRSVLNSTQPSIATVLLIKSIKLSFKQKVLYKLPKNRSHQLSAVNASERYAEKVATDSTELDTSELVDLLQQFAVAHLTSYRHLHAQQYGSVLGTMVTTDVRVQTC